MEHTDLIQDFLKKNNLQDAQFTWMTGDASFRRYARVTKENDSFVLMDTPRSEKPEEFILIDKILVEAGLSAPKIFDIDLDNGFLLLEDLGDDTYTKMLAAGTNEFVLYKLAVDALVEVSRIKDTTGVAPYDTKVIHTGAELFTDWYMPAALGKATDAQAKQAYLNIIDELFESIKDAPKGLMLADYHVDNLMFLPNRKGAAACGLMDFQDGTVGPLAYDLMSLLEDARRDISPVLRQQLLPYYMEEAGVEDEQLFMRSYHVTAIKRHLRVIGIFARLKMRDHKDKYLVHLPRVWRLLESHLNLPYMLPLKNWLDTYVPSAYRGIPDSLQDKQEK